MLIRSARIEDIPQLLDIYRYYVEYTAITFEYETPSQAEFEDRMRKTQERYPYLVAEVDGKVMGYAYAGTFRSRKAFDWSAEVSIYLDQNVRGQGIGRLLYEKLEMALKSMGILNLNACIASIDGEDPYLTNASQRFHEKCGFQLVGKFHHSGYKFHRWYDMIWMEKLIGKHHDLVASVTAYSNDVEEVTKK